MNQEQEIRYIKGIDKDTAYSSYSPDRYYHLQNGKVITIDGSSTGAIEVENGNKLLFKVPNVKPVYKITKNGNQVFTSVTVTINGYTETINATSVIALGESVKNNPKFKCNVYLVGDNFSIYGANELPTFLPNIQADLIKVTETSPSQSGLCIIGMHELRDDLIVFTTNNTSDKPNGYGQIWKVPIDKVTATVPNISDNYLNDMQHLIYHGKLDFSTAYPITEIAVKVDNKQYGKAYFTDGYNVFRQMNIYQDNLMGLPYDAFSIVPNAVLKAPNYYETLTGGHYKSGIVQYTYRLYNKYGATTRFAPLSQIVNITDKNEGEQYSTDYFGAKENKETGKAIKIIINDIDTNYDSIQIVSVYQETMFSTPVISVIADQFNTSNYLAITDSHRDGAEEIDYVTFSALGGKEFITQTVAIKDNYLITANNKELSFNPDYDARVYRFKSDTTTYINLDFNDTKRWGVSEVDNCINPYNEYSKYRSGNYQYKYNLNGELGGVGPNVSYTFTTIPFNIINTTSHDRTCYVTERAYPRTIGNKPYMNWGFNNQASEGFGAIRGFMRNEVYRFGLVFFNKGKVSPVKWIGDIRIPSASEAGYNPFENYGTGTIVVPVFKVNNIPLDEDGNLCSYQIVVVPREGQDMSVLANGYLEPTMHNDDDNDISLDIWGGMRNPPLQPYFINRYQPGLYRFICAETTFNKNMSFKEGDIIEFNLRHTDYPTITELDAEEGPDGLGKFKETTVKLKHFRNLYDTGNPQDRFVDIQDGAVMGPASNPINKINNIYYRNFIRNYIAPGYPTRHYCYSGTTFILGFNFNIDILGVDRGVPYVSYIRPRPAQYGGANYADRSRNEYIPASEVIHGSGIDTYAVYGDVFVGYYESLSRINVKYKFFEDLDLHDGHSRLQVDYLPVESTINVGYRHDTCFSRRGATPIEPNKKSWRLCETVAMGNQVHGTDYYKDVTDLYLYNSVYSRPNNAIKYYPLPFNMPDIKEFDTEIAISEKHLNHQHIDSWCTFLPNNIAYVDGSYGSINKIVNYNNQIHFLQDNALGLIAINERISTPDQTGNTIVLGTGDSLGRFGYINTNTGTTEKMSVVVSGAGLHFFDINSKKWMVYTQGSPTALSDVKGLIGYFNDYLYDYTSDGYSQLKNKRYGIVAVNDNINNRVIATIVKTPLTQREYSTLSFNMMQSAFESFLDCHSPLYATYKNDILMVNPDNLSECWYGQRGNKATFYDKTYDTYVQLITTLRGPTLIMSTLQYDSQSIDANNKDVFNDTFNFVRFINSYQDSGTVPIVDEENARRLMRTWRIWAPRHNDESSLEYDNTILDDARIRDKYALIELRYTNAHNYRFVFHPIKATFIVNNY